MPPWAEDKESALEARLRKKQEASTEDRNVFAKDTPADNNTPVRHTSTDTHDDTLHVVAR
jgi:hypothetical protein